MANHRKCRGCKHRLAPHEARVYYGNNSDDQYHVKCYAAWFQAKKHAEVQALIGKPSKKRTVMHAHPPYVDDLRQKHVEEAMQAMSEKPQAKMPRIRKGAALEPKMPSAAFHLTAQPGRVIAQA